MSTDHGLPPAIPTQFEIYDSYTEDPKWQIKFSIAFFSVVAAGVFLSLRHRVYAVMSGSALDGFGPVRSGQNYIRVEGGTTPTRRPLKATYAPIWLSRLSAMSLWIVPGFNLNLGQLILLGGYIALFMVCVLKDEPLLDTPNRPGFIALAQLPVVFLFGTKNSILSLFLGPGNGYERLNWIHRWSGRIMFLGILLHGSLWIYNHVYFDLPILGQQKETSGVAAFAMLGIIVLSSLKPVRSYFYNTFYVIHMLSFPAFFIVVCYHTIYAPPWIFPPLAFYGADIVLRLLKQRVKDVSLIPIHNQMTLVRVEDSEGGWLAGQHIRVRFFYSSGIFQSHPLSILSAPVSTSCLTNPGLYLGVRASGDWTTALNKYAVDEISVDDAEACEKLSLSSAGIPLQAIIDGPYGGCSLDLGQYEHVLLVSGGSGITFTLGLLDDIVGRCVKLGRPNGEKTKRIEFAWSTRSFGTIEWFNSFLVDIAHVAQGSSIDLHISIYVTCFCNPDAVAKVPNMQVFVERPQVANLLDNFVSTGGQGPLDIENGSQSEVGSSDLQSNAEVKSVSTGEAASPTSWRDNVAVCASGPGVLLREAQNSVARLGLTEGGRLGRIALHTERFSV